VNAVPILSFSRRAQCLIWRRPATRTHDLPLHSLDDIRAFCRESARLSPYGGLHLRAALAART